MVRAPGSKQPPFTSKEKDVDVVLLGTGLPNCILAAALGRAGKKVLHLDPNACYGGAWSTLNLNQLEKWAVRAEDEEEAWIGSHLFTSAGNVDTVAYRYGGPIWTEADLVQDEGENEKQKATETTTANGIKEGAQISRHHAEETAAAITSMAQVPDERTFPTGYSKGSVATSSTATPIPATPTVASTEEGAFPALPAAAETNEGTTCEKTKADPEDEPWVPDAATLKTGKRVKLASDLCRCRKFRWEPFASGASSSGAVARMKQKQARFNLDLLPRCVFTNSKVVEMFLQTGVSRYLEFQSLRGNLSVWDETGGGGGVGGSTKGPGGASTSTPSSSSSSASTSIMAPKAPPTATSKGAFLQVPCSRSGIFQNKQLTLLEKRQLMKLLNETVAVGAYQSEAKLGHDKHESASSTPAPASPSAQEEPPAAATTPQSTSSADTETFESFLQSRLSVRLQHYVLRVVCMEQSALGKSSLSKTEGLLKMKNFADALMRFGTESPFLYPMYGSSDIGQAWTRMGALHEVVFALDNGVEEIYYEYEEDVEVEGDGDGKGEGHEKDLVVGNCSKNKKSAVVVGVKAGNGDFVRCREGLVLGPEFRIVDESAVDAEADPLLAGKRSCKTFTLRLIWVLGGLGNAVSPEVDDEAEVVQPLLGGAPGFGFSVIPVEHAAPIQLLQLDHKSGAVPEGYYAIYAAQSYEMIDSAGIIEAQQLEAALEAALEELSRQVQKLLPPGTDDPGAAGEVGKKTVTRTTTNVLLEVVFAQEVLAPSSSCRSSGGSGSGTTSSTGSGSQPESMEQPHAAKKLHQQSKLPSSLFILEEELATAERLFYDIVGTTNDDEATRRKMNGYEFLEKPKYVQEQEEEQRKQQEGEYKELIGDMAEAADEGARVDSSSSTAAAPAVGEKDTTSPPPENDAAVEQDEKHDSTACRGTEPVTTEFHPENRAA